MKNLIATLCLVLVTEIVFSQNPGSFSKVTTPDIYMPAGSTAIPLHLKNIEGHLYWGTMQLDQGSDSIPWRITPSGIIIPKGSNNVVMPYGAYIAAGSGDVNDDGELDAGDKTIIRNDLRGATQMDSP